MVESLLAKNSIIIIMSILYNDYIRLEVKKINALI